MDFLKLKNRYRQFGGFRLVIEHVRIGVVGTVVKGFFRCLIKRHSFKAIYPEVLKRVGPMLVDKYSHIIQEYKRLRSLSLEHKRSKIVWFCWLQGIDQSPEIVKACHNSLKLHLTDREIRVIDNENWKDYVELPDYILQKWGKGRIPAALFSDLLRLELLIKYGGTWIDSTVLCTGFDGSKVQEFKEYLDTDLFLFQYTKQGSIPVSISNWFITARSNNEVLMVLRDMLYAYWKDYDCVLDYYIFHLFFAMISKEYPEQIAAMPYGYNMNSLVLMYHWHEKFDQENWNKLTSKVCFHKLTFREKNIVVKDTNNYYNMIITTY